MKQNTGGHKFKETVVTRWIFNAGHELRSTGIISRNVFRDIIKASIMVG
jgi:hypothetical protein